MRRIFAILLVLVLSLGPATGIASAADLVRAVTFGASTQPDESHLPACCRKDGAHHCSMKHQPGNPGSGEATLSAAGCRLCWPNTLASTPAPAAALLQASLHLPSLTRFEPLLHGSSVFGRQAQRTWPQRGPPSAPSL